MRRIDSYRKLCFCLCVLAQIAAVGCFAQSSPPSTETASPDLPSDPRKLLLLAAKSNGLAGDDIKPWHLKATFQLADSTGKTTDQGTLEESWAGANKWKRSYASTGFTQTTYGTDHGTFQFGGD
jgi:hypothetical protein